MKILTFADLHDGVTKEESDVLKALEFDACIVLGDIERDSLIKIKDICGDRPIIGVEGNHDERDILENLNIKNVHNKIVELNGYKFLGFGGCLPYKPINGVYLHSQLECSVLLGYAPKADVLISHNSPFGIHDNQENIAHTGYKGIVEYMDRVKPKLCLHGHQHVNEITELDNGTLVVGVYGARILDLSTLD